MTGISRRIREALSEGPSTVSELSDDFRLPRRDVQVGMWVLTHSGQAVSTAKVPSDNRHGARSLNLYELTARGELAREKDLS